MFKAKLRKIGNSLGILIPREAITGKAGDVITIEVITDNVITKAEEVTKEEIAENVISEPTPTWCERKHKGRAVYARTCGCYEQHGKN